jgi:hypothetical protein
MSTVQSNTSSVNPDRRNLIADCRHIAHVCFKAEDWMAGRRDLGTLFSIARDAADADDWDAMVSAVALWEQKRPEVRRRLALIADLTYLRRHSTDAECGVPPWAVGTFPACVRGEEAHRARRAERQTPDTLTSAEQQGAGTLTPDEKARLQAVKARMRSEEQRG